MPESAAVVRPTKKQCELLDFIAQFIDEHGYSPSYREIMNGCNYTSVATVALHVNNLIGRGHLRKRDRSARSLEVTNVSPRAVVEHAPIQAGEEKWLVGHIEARFYAAETAQAVAQSDVDELYVLVGALKILGLEAAARSFIPRLTPLRARQPSE